jgi:hypothetical protein
MQAQDYERSSRASSSELSLWTVHDLLRVFYSVIWDLARLLQTSALLSDLEDHVDPRLEANDPRKTEKRLQWVCTEPVLVMKVWSRLYNLRFNGATWVHENGKAERKHTRAPQSIYDDCMYIQGNMGTLVLLIRNDLAQKYIAYLLWIDQTSGYIHPETKQQMLMSAEKQLYREAVGIYLLAQIKNEKAQITPAKQVEHLLHTASVPFLSSQKPSTHLSTQRS